VYYAPISPRRVSVACRVLRVGPLSRSLALSLSLLLPLLLLAGQRLSTFACRPVCKATHRVDAIDPGLHGHTLLVNVSLAHDEPISLQLWRQAGVEEDPSEMHQVQPPLRRAALRCARPPPPHQTARSMPGSDRREHDVDSWVVSNMWDDRLSANSYASQVMDDRDKGHHTSPAQASRHSDSQNAPDAGSASDTAPNNARALWTCREGEQGGVVLESADALTAPGRLVSVALAARLAPPRAVVELQRSQGRGQQDTDFHQFGPHVLVVAAWDQMCQVGPDDEAAGLPCRTLFTTTRLHLHAPSTLDT